MNRRRRGGYLRHLPIEHLGNLGVVTDRGGGPVIETDEAISDDELYFGPGRAAAGKSSNVTGPENQLQKGREQMAKITEVRIERTRRLADYENLKIGFTVVLNEDDNEIEAVEHFVRFVDWEINKDDRDRLYRQKKAIIESGSANGNRAGIEQWIADYESRAAEFSIDGPTTFGAKGGNNANIKI